VSLALQWVTLVLIVAIGGWRVYSDTASRRRREAGDALYAEVRDLLTIIKGNQEVMEHQRDQAIRAVAGTVREVRQAAVTVTQAAETVKQAVADGPASESGTKVKTLPPEPR
jgi:hypothetical protein